MCSNSVILSVLFHNITQQKWGQASIITVLFTLSPNNGHVGSLCCLRAVNLRLPIGCPSSEVYKKCMDNIEAGG